MPASMGDTDEDDFTWDAEQESTMAAYEAEIATQHARGGSAVPQLHGNAAPRPQPRQQQRVLQQAEAEEAAKAAAVAEEQSRRSGAVRNGTSRTASGPAASLLPSSRSEAVSFDAFSQGQPWDNPIGTAAERSYYLHGEVPSDEAQPQPPPAKKQRLGMGRALPQPPHRANALAPSQRAPAPGPDEVVISRNGRLAAAPDDGEFDDEGMWQDEESLRQIEEQAVQQSQRASQPTRPAAIFRAAQPLGARGPPARSTSSPVGRVTVAHAGPAAANLNARASLAAGPSIAEEPRHAKAPARAPIANPAKLVEELRAQLKEKDTAIRTLTEAKRQQEGEVKIVRKKSETATLKLEQLQQQLDEAMAAHKAEKDRLLREHEDERRSAESVAAMNHMSHTTASRRLIAGGSVQRRPAASLVRDPSGPSSSAAQRAGLTTPTRRGRNGQRSSHALGHEAGDEERSPSQRSAAANRTKLQTPQVPFPNLRNSFAQPGRVARNGSLNSAAKGKAAARDGDGSPDVEMAKAAPDVNGERQPVSAELRSLPWHDVRARYPLMQAIYARRRAALMGHVLAHSSCATHAHRQAGPAPRTVQKLLVAALPAWLPGDTHALYASATANLLGILSSVGDGPQRFAFLAHAAAPSASETDDAADFWDAQRQCEDGLAELLDSIAAVLRAMLQCLMLARHSEAIQDVLSLATSLGCSHRTFVYSLLAPDRQAINDATQAQRTPGVSTAQPFASALVALVRLPVTPDSKGTAAAADSTKGEAQATQTNALPQPWELREEEQNELLASVVGVLEILAWGLLEQDFGRIRVMFDAPGFLSGLLDAKRPTALLCRMMRVLTHLSQYPNAWSTLVACPLEKTRKRVLPHRIAQSQTPLFELLAAHLVDERRDTMPVEAHALHFEIVVFLSQLVIHHAEAAVLVAESAALLAAFVRCLDGDTAAIWHDDGLSVDGDSVKFEDIVTRICMDVRLLAQLYTFPDRPPNLARRLCSEECHAIYNGGRHAYVLALSRIAFADEPPWVDDAERRRMQVVTDLAVELVELMLNPEELEAAWELCAEGASDDRGDAASSGSSTQASNPGAGHATAQPRAAASQTQPETIVIDDDDDDEMDDADAEEAMRGH